MWKSSYMIVVTMTYNIFRVDLYYDQIYVKTQEKVKHIREEFGIKIKDKSSLLQLSSN